MNLKQLNTDQILIVGVIILLIAYYILIVRFWLRCLLSGVRIKQIEIILMRLRKEPVNLILTELIKANKAGVLLDLNQLEACHLADGDVKNVVNGLIYAKAKNINLTFKEAAQLDQQKSDIVIYLRNR